jgi:hypothetical protein
MIQQKQEEHKLTVEGEQKINVYIEVAANQFRRVENQRAEIIKDLAANISRVDGVQKAHIARIIVRGFRQHQVSIQRSYIYQVLSEFPEYKNAAQSEASKQTQKELKEDGYDRPTKTFVTGKNYDPDHVVDYSRSTLVRIVNDQREEIIVLKKRIAELEQTQH